VDSWFFKPPTLLIVLSGPSGVGKDAVLSRMKERGVSLHYTVTVTTRPKREKEVDGRDYYFLTRDRFEQMLASGELLEHASVYGNCYGVPREQVRMALAAGRDVIIKADVQGAATIKKLVPDAVFVFLAPPSVEELAKRLRLRKTETDEAFRLRLETAKREMEALPMFDYVVINENGKLDAAVEKIIAIITAEKCRVTPRTIVV